jgi:hypothetical protein
VAKSRVKVTERGPGFAKLAADLQAGTIDLGVQGKEATMSHPNSTETIGAIAAMHELGLGVPERSFIRSWIDDNEKMLSADAAAALQSVIAGKESRNKAFSRITTKWVNAMRKNIADGNIRPPLAATTIARKGHSVPLLESGTVLNAITGKITLRQAKSIRDPKLRAAVRKGASRG